MVRITALMDNLPSENKALIAEHGLSYWFETDEGCFLFDCGADGNPIKNAWRLGIDLKEAKFVVLTHNHYDHSAGYRDLVAQGFAPDTLYTGPHFFEKKYAFDGTCYTNLSGGFTETFLAEHGITHRVADGVHQLQEGIWLVSGFARTHEFEKIPARFVRGEIGNTQTDDFADESCLVFDTEKGLVLVAGCAHPGILNMTKTVRDALNRPIYAVLGGTHLMEADAERIEKTTEEMAQLGVQLMGLSHCSGATIQKAMHESDRFTCCNLTVGDTIVL